MAFSKFNNFAKAIVDWLRSDSDITTLTADGGTDDTKRVFVSGGDDSVLLPSLLLQIAHEPMIDTVDRLFLARVRCTAVADNTVRVREIIGAVEELAAQNETSLADASFSDVNITSLTVVPRGDIGAVGTRDTSATLQNEPNEFRGETWLEVRWHET